jgi:hypothetical protein
LSSTTEETMIVTLVSEKLERFRKAKELFESDVGKKIEVDDFLDMLVKAFMSYRDKRGVFESSLLQKLTK